MVAIDKILFYQLDEIRIKKKLDLNFLYICYSIRMENIASSENI